ncbi:MAG: response regulator [Planctomycetota bacterium]
MAAAETKYVLIVDDEPDVRNYLAAILEDAGYETGTAGDGATALTMVEARTPDLISLDLVMPGKSGAKFLYALRKNREWSRIPVIIVTGHAKDDQGRADLEGILAGKAISGPETCLEKPVTPEGYVSAVRRNLGLTTEAEPAPVKRPPDDLRTELKKRLDEADPETMRQVLAMLKGRAPEERTGGATGAKRILIIDDEPDVSTYLAALLEDQGYETAWANDPDEGLKMASASPPDLITLDVDMPGKTGVELHRELKQVEGLRDVPIVVITGLQQDMRPKFGENIDGYIQKPFDPDVLYETVSEVLAKHT